MTTLQGRTLRRRGDPILIVSVAGGLFIMRTGRAGGALEDHAFGIRNVEGPAKLLAERKSDQATVASSCYFPEESGAPGFNFAAHWATVQKRAREIRRGDGAPSVAIIPVRKPRRKAVS